MNATYVKTPVDLPQTPHNCCVIGGSLNTSDNRSEQIKSNAKKGRNLLILNNFGKFTINEVNRSEAPVITTRALGRLMGS
jgi:hypothetical protein